MEPEYVNQIRSCVAYTNLSSHPANTKSHFDGMVSTSNHLVPGQDVYIKITKPIVWTVELRVDKLAP